MLTIRKATKSDIPIIRDLTFEIWPATYMPILGPEQVKYMLDTMYNVGILESQMENGQQYILCYDDTQVVAFASYSPHGVGICKLNKIYVLGQLHGKGIGRFILHYLIQEIKAEGSKIMELNVNIYNVTAKQFYERLGFSVYREEDIDIGSGYFMNDFVMRMAL